MTYELALELAKTETPEQMAGRIVELYETIGCQDVEEQRLTAENERLKERLARMRHTLRMVDGDIGWHELRGKTQDAIYNSLSDGGNDE